MANDEGRVSMSDEALRCYRLLTELSLAFGLIDTEEFEKRERFLAELVADPTRDNPDGTADAQEEGASSGPAVAENRDPAHADVVAKAGSAPPDWLQFIPATGPLKEWHFIKGDPDPHPAVPHGHSHGATFPKLDPYLGWVHASTSKTGRRLSKKETAVLWNDDRFRDFASAALLHFVQEHPGYVWRVPFPLRLPHHRR